MSSSRVGIVGASGYSGAIAARILASHPSLTLAFCTSDKWAGASVQRHLAVALRETHSTMAFEPNGRAADLSDRCDAVFLATSAEVSSKLAPLFLAANKDVIDLSGAFRLEASAYPTWYGFEHPSPEHLVRAHYGLPELFGPPRRTGTDAVLVANPGCYPTASLLPLAPLLRAGLIEADGIIVDAKSGVTGAGRQASEAYSFAEVDGDFRAYKVLKHQHTPEIARALGVTSLTFTAHLLPVRRGLLSTAYARPRPGTTAKQVAECLAETYAKAAFVRAVPPEQATLNAVVGTNLAFVGATANADVVVTVGVLDNLVKGAAGQAVQNLNLLWGLDETAGLASLQRFAP
ncbi:MAG: N-acetyl-gamma-glutamyl-phosphate reductase [Myxococcales bacterium]